jgi:hypothetical protein
MCLLEDHIGLSFGYDVSHGTVHFDVCHALNAIDCSTDPFFDSIKSPVHVTAEELQKLEDGFAAMSNCKPCGTITAGDGIILGWPCLKMRKLIVLLCSERVLCIWFAGKVPYYLSL